MFSELMPLLGERTVMITISRLNQNSIRVNFIPSRKKEDEQCSTCDPTEFFRDTGGTGSGAGKESRVFRRRESAVPEHARRAKAEMEAAAKAARDQAKAKSALKHEETRGCSAQGTGGRECQNRR